jgi:hypothetical protein
MLLTRRGILALAGFGVSDVLSGCFGSSDDGTAASSNGDGGGGGGNGGDSGGGGTSTPNQTATTTPSLELTYPTLAQRTADIWAELDWFVDDYSNAIQGYISAVNQVLTRLDQLDPSTGITQEQLDRVEASSAELVDYVESNIDPHFDVHPGLLRADNVYINNIRRAARRGDRDAQRSELSLARSFYRRMTSQPYIRNELSRRPIYDTLYSQLVASDSVERVFGLLYPERDFVSVAHPDKTESAPTDGVDQHEHEFPAGHVVYGHVHGHDQGHTLSDHENDPERRELYAYKDGGISILEDDVLWRNGLDDFEPLHEDIFGPIRHADRTNALYLTVNGLTQNFTELPIFVQRFGSPTAARDARKELTRKPNGIDGTEKLGGRQWDRFFYQLGDVTMYAFLIVAGEFVFVAIPNPDTWERRTDQFSRLSKTWLGVGEGTGGEDG